jgi:hypothetical protein
MTSEVHALGTHDRDTLLAPGRGQQFSNASAKVVREHVVCIVAEAIVA